MHKPLRKLLRKALQNLALAAALLWAVALPARATEAETTAADPVLEARVMAISSELRCLVCQNQTIADSHAGLAIDLRNQVREMLRQGQNQEQIVAYMTARYGDFVLYRPPLKESTALLWFGPAALLVGGLLVLTLVLRKRARMAPEQFESDDDSVPAPQPDATPATDSPSR
jgi:cytochrome c-type biogenesis protein CcmH